MASDNEIVSRMERARELVLRAGKRTLEHFRQGVSAELKADQTPVTIADREAEAMLRENLSAHFSSDGFLGEEFGDEPGSSGFRWIIDPIDATKNFVRGIPLFATLVGLECEGKLVGGLAYVPAMDHIYRAIKGHGAFQNDRPIHVSNVDRLESAYLCYSSLEYFDQTGTTEAYLDLARSVAWSRGFGDFYGHLLVADGAVDVMIEPTINPWDIAALKPIVEEAGGVMTDWFGNDTIFGTGCISANPAIHRLVLDRLSDIK